MNRLFLYSGLLFILILIFDAYERDYSMPEVDVVSAIDDQPLISKQPPVPDVQIENKATPNKSYNARKIATLENNKLLINYDALTGELLFSELKDYSKELGSKQKITILDYDNKSYTASSNIQVKDVKANPIYQIIKNSKDSVTLQSKNINGILITKKIRIINNSHQVEIINMVTNETVAPISARNYEVISRDDNNSASIMLPTYTGSAYYDAEDKFSKLSFEDMADNNQAIKTKNSWISMIEHYFFSAWLPTNSKQKTIYTNYDQGIYTIGSSTNYSQIEPGESLIFNSLIFTGPKLQSEISNLTEGLDLTVDYGVLTFISGPLFWILGAINGLFSNWGFSIIMLTVLIKAVFFKLSETSYRSMAQMKKLNPRMQALKERYAEDKKKFSEALMRMYKEEKVNPLGGCLPILIQIPVFIALYWVLVESIELRHAPFIGWINDLSSADPFFILPIAMGVSMYVQQKLNPAPTDPMQQKIFLFLPFIFTALFATFPSGLVLYWLTNNVLSIAQQYVINKRIVG